MSAPSGGIIGATSSHSASVRSLGYRGCFDPAARRGSGFHIGCFPKRIMRLIRNLIRFIRLKKFPDRLLSLRKLRVIQ